MVSLTPKQLMSRLRKIKRQIHVENRKKKRVEDKIKKLNADVRHKEHQLKEARKAARSKKKKKK
jgi:hypothetical protein